MKQHITINQLNELSKEQKKKLVNWWKPRAGDLYAVDKPNELLEEVFIFGGLGGVAAFIAEKPYYPLLSIGQMIELLEDSGNAWWSVRKEEINVFVGEIPDGYEGHYSVYMDEKTTGNTLCDALWSACKEEL